MPFGVSSSKYGGLLTTVTLNLYTGLSMLVSVNYTVISWTPTISHILGSKVIISSFKLTKVETSGGPILIYVGLISSSINGGNL
jgi:hypothetical protein